MSLSNTTFQKNNGSKSSHLLQPGTVYKKTIGSYTVHSGERTITCSLSSRLRKEFSYPTADPHSLRRVVKKVKAIEHVDPIAIGDFVHYVEAPDGTGMIVEVLPRHNRFARKTAVPMPGAHAFEQVIVANIDQVVPVFAAANPAPRWNMLDRYLVAAESLSLPVHICITKLDLVMDEKGVLNDEIAEVVSDYRRIGYPVTLVSAFTGAGLGDLGEALKSRISVFVGKSGVGKSSLLNVLQPGLGLRVKEVSQATGKGRHTTSHLEMFPLELGGSDGGAIVDTPGTREFGLWDVEQDDLALFFPEMRPLVGLCRFGLDCQHDEEPGCAVRQAVVAGQISPRRYQSYMHLHQDF